MPRIDWTRIDWNYVLNVTGRLLVSGAMIVMAVAVFVPMLTWVWGSSEGAERLALVVIGTVILGVMLVTATE